MNKIAAVILVSSVFAVGAFAEGKPAPKTLHCAVMTSNTVTVADATKSKMYADYKGKRYFFCCGMCKPQFKNDPAKFAKKGESIPTPGTKKKK